MIKIKNQTKPSKKAGTLHTIMFNTLCLNISVSWKRFFFFIEQETKMCVHMHAHTHTQAQNYGTKKSRIEL